MGIGCLVFEGQVPLNRRLPRNYDPFAKKMHNAANMNGQEQYKPAIAAKRTLFSGSVRVCADALNDSYDFTFQEIAKFVWPEGYSETGEKLT